MRFTFKKLIIYTFLFAGISINFFAYTPNVQADHCAGPDDAGCNCNSACVADKCGTGEWQGPVCGEGGGGAIPPTEYNSAPFSHSNDFSPEIGYNNNYKYNNNSSLVEKIYNWLISLK